MVLDDLSAELARQAAKVRDLFGGDAMYDADADAIRDVCKLAEIVRQLAEVVTLDLRGDLEHVTRARDEAVRDRVEYRSMLRTMDAANAKLATERDAALRERDEALAEGVLSQRVCDLQNELVQAAAERDAARDAACCKGEPHTCDQEAIAAAEGKTDRLILELAERNAQLDATRNAIGAECVEHVELNGHIDIAEQCRDYLTHVMDGSDPSDRLQDFVAALRIVIDQCDRQRRRANWYESAYTAGKQKVIESAVERALSRARAAAQVYTERVDALGLAADDNDPLVMATAKPIGTAQADLYAALGLLERSELGGIVVKQPTETVEQLRAERDAARVLAEIRGRERDAVKADRANAICDAMDAAEQEERERIAAWLDGIARASATNIRAAFAETWAAAIRANAHADKGTL